MDRNPFFINKISEDFQKRFFEIYFEGLVTFIRYSYWYSDYGILIQRVHEYTENTILISPYLKSTARKVLRDRPILHYKH